MCPDIAAAAAVIEAVGEGLDREQTISRVPQDAQVVVVLAAVVLVLLFLDHFDLGGPCAYLTTEP